VKFWSLRAPLTKDGVLHIDPTRRELRTEFVDRSATPPFPRLCAGSASLITAFGACSNFTHVTARQTVRHLPWGGRESLEG